MRTRLSMVTYSFGGLALGFLMLRLPCKSVVVFLFRFPSLSDWFGICKDASSLLRFGLGPTNPVRLLRAKIPPLSIAFASTIILLISECVKRKIHPAERYANDMPQFEGKRPHRTSPAQMHSASMGDAVCLFELLN